MKILAVLALFSVFTVATLRAQEETPPKMEEIRMGTILLVQDARIHAIIDRQVTLNKRKGGIDGYRIQVFFNSGRDAREEAIRIKADFLSEYPDTPVYIVYHSPFYKVRIGDFRSKYEALGVFRQVRKKYPAAYIVKDVIPFPDLDK
jgi:mRNA-degrading endonuclease RelE of RelBE toxin-antitoxin system